MDLKDALQKLTPDIIERFKTGVETGRWPDGRTLTAQQREICMQAIIAYEHKHLEEDQRTGYVPPKKTSCGPEDDQTPLKWK